MAVRTIRPGELTASQLEVHETTVKASEVPTWIMVADHVLDRLPTVAGRLGALKLGPGGGHIVALWIVLATGIVGGVVHVIGDGSLRAKVDRTECRVEWLVERAVAQDLGQPAPPFSPLACDHR